MLLLNFLIIVEKYELGLIEGFKPPSNRLRKALQKKEAKERKERNPESNKPTKGQEAKRHRQRI